MNVPRLQGMPREMEAAIIWTPSKGYIEQRNKVHQKLPSRTPAAARKKPPRFPATCCMISGQN